MADNRKPTPRTRPLGDRTHDPRRTGPSSDRPQTTDPRKGDELKPPAGDLTGEMEDAGGGRNTGGGVVDPSRPNQGSSVTWLAVAHLLAPHNDSDERSVAERTAAANALVRLKRRASR